MRLATGFLGCAIELEFVDIKNSYSYNDKTDLSVERLLSSSGKGRGSTTGFFCCCSCLFFFSANLANTLAVYIVYFFHCHVVIVMACISHSYVQMFAHVHVVYFHDLEFDECSSSPCLNGGTCTDGINNYTCACPSPFFGRRCQGTETTYSILALKQFLTRIHVRRNARLLIESSILHRPKDFPSSCPLRMSQTPNARYQYKII